MNVKVYLLILGLLIFFRPTAAQNPQKMYAEIPHLDFTVHGDTIFFLLKDKLVARDANTFAIVWEVASDVSDGGKANVYADGNHVFTAGYEKGEGFDKYVYAFDARTGNRLWKYQYPEENGDINFAGISHGLFVFYGQKKLVGIDIVTGKKVLSEKVSGSDAKAHDDFLYISQYEYSSDGPNKYWLNVYDYTGKEISESVIIGDTIFTSFTYSDTDILILKSEISGWSRSYIVDRKTNHVLWECKNFRSRYIRTGDEIIEIGYAWITGFELRTGKELWKYDIEGSSEDKAREIVDAINGPENAILVCTKGGEVVKLDGTTGQVIWKKDPLSEIIAFEVNNGRMYISRGGRDRYDHASKTHLEILDISQMTAALLQAENRKKETQKRIEEQRANTFLTIQNGGHISLIRKMAVTKDGKQIITAGDDKVIYIRNAETGDVIDALYGKIGDGSEGKIYAMALSPDNKYLAVAGYFAPQNDFSGKLGAIRLYDFPSRKLIGILQDGKSDVVNALTFSEDSKFLVSGAASKIKIWDVGERKFLRALKEEHGLPIYSLAVFHGKIISGALDWKVILWDINNPSPIKIDSTHTKGVNCVAVSPDGSTIASGGFDNTLVFYDSALTVVQKVDNGTSPSSIAFSPDGKKILLGTEGDSLVSNMYHFNGTSWQKLISYSGLQISSTLATAFLNNTTAVCAGGENYEIVSWTWQTDSKSKKITAKEVKRFSGKGKPVYGVGIKDYQLYFTNSFAEDFMKATLTRSFDLFSHKYSQVSELPSHVSRAVTQQGEYSLTASESGEKDMTKTALQKSALRVQKNGTDIAKIVKEQFEGFEHISYTFTKNNYVVSGGYNGIMLAYNLEGNIVARFIGHRDMINEIVPSPDGRFLISCSSDQTIKIWNAFQIGDEGEEDVEVPAPADVADPAFKTYYEQRNLVNESQTKTTQAWYAIISDMSELGFNDYAEYFRKMLRYFSAKVVKPIASIYFGTDNEWIIWSDDGYFTSSKYGGKYIGYHINQGFEKEAKYYPFEQFDLKFNRPDIMLSRVGIDAAALSAAYYAAFKKRVAKMGLQEATLSEELHLPEILLQSRSKETSTSSINVEFDARDKYYNIDRVNVFVNDIPIYGSNGLSVKESHQQEIHEKLSVELTKGKNKIQISALNDQGAESMKETYYVLCNNQSKKVKNRFAVVIGVSDYANNDYDLKYASKDASDVAKLLETSKGEFGNTKVLRILDKQATRENIEKAKQFLMQSGVEDQAIVFVAGHGLLDDKLDWYFGTTDVDFNNPSARGLAYGDLEGILDSIPARNRLMFMDACHSGEVDKDESQLLSDVSRQTPGVKTRGFKKVVSKNQSLGLKNSFQLMQELFADLSKGTGTTVVSSASGAEFAYESSQWNNGVFTYALIDGLK